MKSEYIRTAHVLAFNNSLGKYIGEAIPKCSKSDVAGCLDSNIYSPVVEAINYSVKSSLNTFLGKRK